MASQSWPQLREFRQEYAPLVSPIRDVGVVYFIGWANGAVVKVGYSSNFWEGRLRDHVKAKSHEEPPTVLAVVRGTRKAEKAVLEYFKPYQFKGQREEFRAAALLPYLAWLRDHYFVSITESEFHTAVGQTVIDEEIWLPGRGRESDRRSEPLLWTLTDPWAVLPSRDITGDDWYTPPEYIEPARAALGGTIDLDPASHVIANRIVRARKFFTRQQNGLAQPWSGRVWMNPPFSEWEKWVDKMLTERPNCDAIVTLGAVRTMTSKYFQPLLQEADAMCVMAGRLRFWGLHSESTSPPDGHFLLYFGDDVALFRSSMAKLGSRMGSLWVRT